MSVTYTAEISGTPTLTVEISSTAIRLRAGSDSYASIVAQFSAALATALSTRTGETLTVYRNATEICTVDIDSIRSDVGAQRASISVAGHDTISWGTPGSHTLSGVAYYNSANNYRTLVDLDIKPGDEATGPGGTFTIGLVTINANASGETMDLSEG